MVVGDTIVSDNPSNGDHPAVNSTVGPTVNIASNVASVNLNSNGVNSTVNTSNGLPTSHVVYGTQSPPVFSQTLPYSVGSSIPSSPQAHIAVPETVADNTW
ncbi:hypothetical protein V6N11_012181 [Hibiscus sabdariffa]|uniref:Uncharacterized protein n=1 Tax=Hibiscus sabdariffa TaxID=183260 RepID=A0ABR2QAB3_9ROSI